jgi:hypothetical protein
MTWPRMEPEAESWVNWGDTYRTRLQPGDMVCGVFGPTNQRLNAQVRADEVRTERRRTSILPILCPVFGVRGSSSGP